MTTVSEAEERAAGGLRGDGELALVEPVVRELPARIVSSRARLGARLIELWKARELFFFLVRKDLKVKYKGSVLGILWSLLNPAVMLLVYYIVFGKFMKAGYPQFALFLFAGMIAWNLFQTALMGSSSVIVANAGIVKKVSFPREILALAQVGTATMFFFFQAIVLVIFLAGFQVAPVWHLLPMLLFALVDLIVFTAALSLFLSAVTVYLRDVEHLITVLLMAWYWAIPMIYSYSWTTSGDHRWLADLFLIDPLVPITLVFQRAIYGLRTFTSGTKVLTVTANYPISFELELLLIVLVVSLALFFVAMVIFRRIEGNFAEEL